MVDFDGLKKEWNEDDHNHLLILIAPKNTYYEQLSKECDCVLFYENYDENALSVNAVINAITDVLVQR